MNMLSKYANLYFHVARKIIETANMNDGISENELNAIARNYGVIEDYIDFVNGITCKLAKDNKFSGLAVLKPIGNNKYSSLIDRLPLILSKSEKEALFDSLSWDIAAAFISEKTLAKFGIISQPTKHTIILSKVVLAIKSDMWLVFDNFAGNGRIYCEQHLKPQKVEYSLATREFFVSGYCREAGRLIKCNFERMTIRGIEDGEIVDMGPALEQKRCAEPIRLSIENRKNAIDRAFNIFSSYEKDGLYDKKTGRFMLDIYYYEFEEYVLTDKILSLGVAALVISPSKIQEKIKRRVQEQLLKLT